MKTKDIISEMPSEWGFDVVVGTAKSPKKKEC
jgi:hypothetical protein